MVINQNAADGSATDFDAIVVGSGYGGGVSASRLARMGFRVAVLEQGRHMRPGDFPTTIKARRKELRLTGNAPKLGDPAGMYYLSVGKGLSVFGASGLGGSSLINAGVVLRPNFERLRKAGWPEDIVDDGHLLEGLKRAERMLGVGPAPEPERFAKYHGMRRLAEASGISLTLPSMTISHGPNHNPEDVMQYACRYCGDCWSGCNVGAKNTVGLTYIADAIDHGATVLCESRAEEISKTANGWAVEIKNLSKSGGTRRLTSRIVVLAAGTMGTNELMLRAQRKGLTLSTRLGSNFSANGDDMAFASEFKEPVHAIATGFPSQAPRGAPLVGPHSMSIIDLSDEDGPLWVHDGTMLTVMAGLAPLKEMLKLKVTRAWRIIRQGAFGDELSRTQVLYIVATDDSSGRVRLQGDHAMVDWPEYGKAPERSRAQNKVKALIERAGGTYQPNPFVMRTFGGNRIIAHPLGGCGMGKTSDDGVISSDGRVFDPSKGPRGFHDGLYICDGAATPTAVGVSPLLTISALAERAMILAAERLGRTLDINAAPKRPSRDAAM